MIDLRKPKIEDFKHIEASYTDSANRKTFASFYKVKRASYVIPRTEHKITKLPEGILWVHLLIPNSIHRWYKSVTLFLHWQSLRVSTARALTINTSSLVHTRKWATAALTNIHFASETSGYTSRVSLPCATILQSSRATYHRHLLPQCAASCSPLSATRIQRASWSCMTKSASRARPTTYQVAVCRQAANSAVWLSRTEK